MIKCVRCGGVVTKGADGYLGCDTCGSEHKWTPGLATAYSEGVLIGADATDEERTWAREYLYDTGIEWTFQGAILRALVNEADKAK